MASMLLRMKKPTTRHDTRRTTMAPHPADASGASYPPAERRPATWHRWVGLLVQVAVGVFPLASSGLFAPPWALALIAVGWACGVVLAWRLGRTRPILAMAVPVVTVAVWFALLTVGDRWLGWAG
jgi:hypothetical protein